MPKVVNFSEALSIGIHGMVLIARSKDIVNVQTIADATNASRHHVAKVMQRLVKEEFLTSTRGPAGGFRIKKKLEDIKILDIYEAIEGKIILSDCPLDNPVCPFGQCLLGGVVADLTKQFRDHLYNNSLKDLI